MRQGGNITEKVTWHNSGRMFWVTLRNGLVSTKPGMATVTGKTFLISKDFLLLSIQIQIGDMFLQPN